MKPFNTLLILLEKQDQIQQLSSKAQEYLNWGAGPRASQNLILAAKAKSIMDGQGSPTISHVKAVAKPILRHRIVINYKAKAEGLSADDIIEQLL